MTTMLDEFRTQLLKIGTLTFTFKVRASAQRTQFKEILDDGTVKIDVAAVPEDGKANEELIRFLAQEFDVGRSNIEIVSGHTSRIKVVRIKRRTEIPGLLDDVADIF